MTAHPEIDKLQKASANLQRDALVLQLQQAIQSDRANSEDLNRIDLGSAVARLVDKMLNLSAGVPSVVLTVKGGVIQACVANQPIEVALIDLDIDGMNDHQVHALDDADGDAPTFAATRMISVQIDAELCAHQMHQVLVPVTAAQHQQSAYGDGDGMPANMPEEY